MNAKKVIEIIERIIEENDFCRHIRFSTETIRALYIAANSVKTHMIAEAPEVIGNGNIRCKACGTVLGLPSLGKKYCRQCGKKLMD